MSTETLEANHKLSCQLAADGIDTAKGIIRGATVAKSGVQATGKFVMLDAKGAITRDPELAVGEAPVFTDEKTLTTLMAAAKAAGKQIKSREDHVDGVGARAGYADTFKLTDDGRVIADIHLFKSYRNRDVVLETAQETPGEMGLSIDFVPSYELRDGKALMRVTELNAVDIVDEGAITHGGLFLSASVDTGRKVESPKKHSDAMATETSPNDAVLAAITQLGKTMTEALSKLAAPAAATTETKTETNAAKTETAQLSAADIEARIDAKVKEELLKLKRTNQALGLKADTSETVKLAAGGENTSTAKDTAKPKNYLQLVAERAESAKCKKSEAHQWVMKNHKDEYAAHLTAKGVVRAEAA